MLKVSSARSVLTLLFCAPHFVQLKCICVCMPGLYTGLYFSHVCVLLWRVCVCACMWMRKRDKKKMKNRSKELSHSEASPSVRLGLIVPGCEDMGGKKRKESNCTRPVSQSYFCNIKRAPPDYCHVNNGTWLRSLLMNVIYFSKRGLIIDRGPLSPPTGSASQLAAKRWLLIFVVFRINLYVRMCAYVRWHGEYPPN